MHDPGQEGGSQKVETQKDQGATVEFDNLAGGWLD